MKYSLLEDLVQSHAKKLAHDDALGGGRGDGGSYALLQELSSVKQQLIIIHDLRPSEVDAKVPDMVAAREATLGIPKHSIIAMDKGYMDLKWFRMVPYLRKIF